MNSINEPMTPPDYSYGGSDSGEEFRFPNDYSPSYNLQYTTTISNSDNTPNNLQILLPKSSAPAPAARVTSSGSDFNVSLNNSSPINTNIGGNKFRTRFKSLPSMDDLDHKFNRISLGAASGFTNKLQPSPFTIENLSLSGNRTTLNQLGGRNSISSGSISNLQHLNSNNQITISFSNTITKNLDDLNLIPIENLDILNLSVDQYGCRFLQKRIEVDKKMVEVVFNKIFNHLLELIVDPFGNYLIQKLVDHLLPYQKDLMIEKIHTHLFGIAINQYGTRSLQKIIDSVSNSYQMDLVVKGLQVNDTLSVDDDNNVVKLIKDLNGNHVIQKCIYRFPAKKFQFIIDSICVSNNIVRISTHKHGCCVLQKLLNNSDLNQILNISNVLLIYLDDLVNDQFGNYIIQFLFELNFLKTSEEINFLIDKFFNKIFNNLVSLSCLKFSSNVIEKFIRILKIKQNYVYLTEIIRLTNQNFEIMIRDKFGNYVIQTLLDQFYGANELGLEMANLIINIKKFLPLIKTAPYGKKMQLKVQQLEAYHFNFTSQQPYPHPNINPDYRQPINYNHVYQNQPNYDDNNKQKISIPVYHNYQKNNYNASMNYPNNYVTNQGPRDYINTKESSCIYNSPS